MIFRISDKSLTQYLSCLIAKLRIFVAVCISVLAFFVTSTVQAADITGYSAGIYSIRGVRLGDTEESVAKAHATLPIANFSARQGGSLGRKGFTQEGLPDGGFFQVLFSRPELGGGVWSVTLNKRVEVKQHNAEPILEQYMETYGVYDRLCRFVYGDHAVYYVYWGAEPESCDIPGERPQRPHLFLTLVLGKWTEEFVNLIDPQLAQKNVALSVQDVLKQ